MINQRTIRNNYYSTLAEIKAINDGNDLTFCYCLETDTIYKWLSNGSSYTADNTFVLITGKGGNTRWIGENGVYINHSINSNSINQNYFLGNLAIGINSSSNAKFKIGGDTSGNTTYYGNYINTLIKSDVTSLYCANATLIDTQATTFTLTTLNHYRASQGTIGLNSTITNQIGYYASSNLISGTNNYSFYGDIPSGTNRWNLYMNGTAQNYISGNIGIGVTVPTSYLHIKAGTASANTSPIKLTTSGIGVVLTNKEAGAIEYEGALFYTTSDLVRIGIGGDIFVDSLDKQPASTGSEQTLSTFTFPANAFDDNNDHISFDISITFANNANNKRYRIYFGSTTIWDSANATYGRNNPNNAVCRISGKVYRRATNSEYSVVTVHSTLTAQIVNGYTIQIPMTETTSNEIIFKTTALNATATTDLTQNTLDLHFEPHHA